MIFFKRNILLACILLFLPSLVQSQVREVKSVFDAYKSAILNDQGKDALNVLDNRTIKYYNDLAHKIRTADSTTIESLPLVDKMTVLIVRLKASKEEMYAFDGKSLLIYAIDNGMIGKNSVLKNSIGKVIVNQHFAKGEVLSDGKKTSLYFHFYKESDKWKINITSLFPLVESALKKMVADSGKSENEFLLPILEVVARKKPGPEIWQPLKE